MRKAVPIILCVLTAALGFHAQAIRLLGPELDAGFGILKGGRFVETDKIPWVKGQIYGFHLLLPGHGAQVPVRIEMQLPAPATDWGIPQPYAPIIVSKDGTMASYPSTATAGTVIGLLWSVADGDPEGKYKVRVYVRNRLIKTFIIYVYRPHPDTKPDAGSRFSQ